MSDQTQFETKFAPAGQRALAQQILRTSTKAEAAALAAYFEQLLAIRQSALNTRAKVRLAIDQTIDGDLILPLLTVVAKEVQAIWSRVALPGRLGILASAVALTAFGRAGGGIAVLGTAVGVPLWVVAGSGATLAHAFVDLFRATIQSPEHHNVVDAEFVVVEHAGAARERLGA